MSTCRMANDGRTSQVETWVRRHCLNNVASSEVDVEKSSRPSASPVADPPVFQVARDYSSRGEGSKEMPNMEQQIVATDERKSKRVTKCKGYSEKSSDRIVCQC